MKWSDGLLCQDPQQLRVNDWLGIFCAHRFSTAATIEIISSLICEENILHKHLLKGLLKVLHFHFGTFVNFSPKIFYIPENVAGCKFWWVETTITRRDKVFWEKESQMRGRRGSILGWHIWRFSFLLFPLCIELKHCPFFFSFSTYIIKGGQKIKREWNDRSVLIYWALTIICFLRVLRPYHFGEKSLAKFGHFSYTLKTANISRQNVGFCAASAIWASRVSFIIRLLLLQPSFSSSLRHKRPAVRSTRSVNINHTLRTLSSFEGNKISKCTFASWLLNDRTVLWH